MAVFNPTGTTKALIEAAKPFIKGGKLLDLGCGCGVVGKSFDCEVYASDISKEAVDSVYPPIITRCGNLFEPWEGFKFDYIIDDVSGVAEEIAKISPWFNGVPCDSGIDGTNLITKVLRQAPNYLEPEGKLFFPVVSLSNVKETIRIAEANFDHVELLSHNKFPLPLMMYEHIGLLRKMKEHGIEFQEGFGMAIWFTDIYIAYGI